jgi:hypothetical protein
MLHCYVLTCGRSVTAFRRPLEVSARGKGPARPTQKPALYTNTLMFYYKTEWIQSSRDMCHWEDRSTPLRNIGNHLPVNTTLTAHKTSTVTIIHRVPERGNRYASFITPSLHLPGVTRLFSTCISSYLIKKTASKCRLPVSKPGFVC